MQDPYQRVAITLKADVLEIANVRHRYRSVPVA